MFPAFQKAKAQVRLSFSFPHASDPRGAFPGPAPAAARGELPSREPSEDLADDPPGGLDRGAAPRVWAAVPPDVPGEWALAIVRVLDRGVAPRVWAALPPDAPGGWVPAVEQARDRGDAPRVLDEVPWGVPGGRQGVHWRWLDRGSRRASWRVDRRQGARRSRPPAGPLKAPMTWTSV